MKTWCNSLHCSAAGYAIMSLASSVNKFLLLKNCDRSSGVGAVCGLLGRNQKLTFSKNVDNII